MQPHRPCHTEGVDNVFKGMKLASCQCVPCTWNTNILLVSCVSFWGTHGQELRCPGTNHVDVPVTTFVVCFWDPSDNLLEPHNIIQFQSSSTRAPLAEPTREPQKASCTLPGRCARTDHILTTTFPKLAPPCPQQGNPLNGAQQKAWDERLAGDLASHTRIGVVLFFLFLFLPIPRPCTPFFFFLRRPDANVVQSNLFLTDVGAGAIHFVSLRDHLHVTVSSWSCALAPEMVFLAKPCRSDSVISRTCSLQSPPIHSSRSVSDHS